MLKPIGKMIYDYLFFKSYQLAKKSKNWNDTPFLLAIMVIGSCLLFNLGTINCIVDITGIMKSISFDNKYRYLIGLILTAVLALYYTKNDRYKRIISRYTAKEEESEKNVHPLLIVGIYLLVSLILLVIFAMLKNHNGIFSA